MSEDSIFEALWEKEEKVEETRVEKKEEQPAKVKGDKQLQPQGDRYNRRAEGLNYALDPQPRKRWLWERQQIIKAARRGWVITKQQHLRRTERQCRETSPWLKTSIKKLNPLARQIAGKTVDEALLQLRFSRKRVALEVAKHLEHARDQAIVKWGMSLGKVNGTAGGPVAIKLKDKTKKVVTDRTELYIAQAFVSRGSYVKTVELRAKGRANMLKRPHTSITFLLKEEATRIREHKEKQEKALRKKPFTPLPDRPITQQRQYVLW